jgi:hypothetical protein
MTLQNDEMIANCVNAYLGNSPATQDFVSQFVRLKEFELDQPIRSQSRNAQVKSSITNSSANNISSESSGDEQRSRRRRRKAH